jgi:hypothetical protein
MEFQVSMRKVINYYLQWQIRGGLLANNILKRAEYCLEIATELAYLIRCLGSENSSPLSIGIVRTY